MTKKETKKTTHRLEIIVTEEKISENEASVDVKTNINGSLKKIGEAIGRQMLESKNVEKIIVYALAESIVSSVDETKNE